MILSYKELKKRDVVNIADGRSFGKITDMKLDFPCAALKGIVVCDRKRGGLFGLWCKNEIFIDEKQIIRIGGDVILVNVKNCDAVTAVVDINGKNEQPPAQQRKKPAPPCPPCPPKTPPCPPAFPAVCPPPDPCAANPAGADFSDEFRIDFEDY